MYAKPRQAFTLVELLIGMFLLSLILGVTAAAISWSVRSHRFGEAKRQAVALGREALNRISNELSTSLAMGLLPNGGELRSGVVYPDYSSVLYQPFSEQLYKREHVQQTLPDAGTVGVDRAYNRVIFTAPGRRSTAFQDRLSDYVFVEYLVLPRVGQANASQNKLYRRTFQVLSNPLATEIPGLTLAGAYEVIKPDFFALDITNPLDNPNMVDAAQSVDARNQTGLVLELPRIDDQIQFSVEHTTAAALRTTPLPSDPAYQPALFTVSVSILIDYQGNNKYYGSQVLSQQVTIKSGY